MTGERLSVMQVERHRHPSLFSRIWKGSQLMILLFNCTKQNGWPFYTDNGNRSTGLESATRALRWDKGNQSKPSVTISADNFRMLTKKCPEVGVEAQVHSMTSAAARRFYCPGAAVVSLEDLTIKIGQIFPRFSFANAGLLTVFLNNFNKTTF
jgi:hypothetical protein